MQQQVVNLLSVVTVKMELSIAIPLSQPIDQNAIDIHFLYSF